MFFSIFALILTKALPKRVFSSIFELILIKALPKRIFSLFLPLLYKAALLTRCYVQHFLSPYIDSEVNHKRHFIKIPFINKGIEFIDLHSIFKDNSVISSIPNYLNNSETPIICYKYSKPIRSTIFNFNKIVNDLDIDSILLPPEIVKIQIIYIPLQGMLLQVI